MTIDRPPSGEIGYTMTVTGGGCGSLGRRKTSTGSLVATDDLGRKYTIHIYKKLISGEHNLRLSDGTHVERLGKGQYEVIQPNGRLLLRSEHPDAP